MREAPNSVVVVKIDGGDDAGLCRKVCLGLGVESRACLVDAAFMDLAFSRRKAASV